MEQTETLAPREGLDDGDVEEFVTHLYPFTGQPNSSFTFCGLHVSQDAHAQMHKGYGQKSPRWSWVTGGPGNCPTCGAPLCPACERRS